jgi:sugar lactone lactonase YvrE
MKQLLIIVLLLLAINVHAQHKLEKLWETDTVINVPESVMPDPDKNLLYVSLVGNKPGNGGISILGTDGKVINKTFTSGLNAAKGMARYKDKIYITSLTEVAVVDITSGKIAQKIPVDSAVFLNDIAIDSKGVVYVSDTRRGKVHRIINGKVSTWLSNIKSANGLKLIGNDLYILSSTSLLKVTPKREITTIATISCEGDGLEPAGNGDFIATCWTGYVFYIHANGKVDTLLDTHEQKINTADIAYDIKQRILYIPTFNAKKVMAFSLK